MSTSQGHILVVDDDEGILEVLCALLEGEGYSVVTAEDGVVALRLIEQQPPRLILLDLQMPVMDGCDCARHYRQRPGPHAPLIAMTAAEEVGTFAAQVAAAGCLGKPFEVNDVLAVVELHAPPVHRGDGTTRGVA